MPPDVKLTSISRLTSHARCLIADREGAEGARVVAAAAPPDAGSLRWSAEHRTIVRLMAGVDATTFKTTADNPDVLTLVEQLQPASVNVGHMSSHAPAYTGRNPRLRVLR